MFTELEVGPTMGVHWFGDEEFVGGDLLRIFE